MSTPSNLNAAPRTQGKNAWMIWGTVLLACAAVLVGTYLLFVGAPPPSRFVIATGGQAGAYYKLGLKYAKELKKEGLTVDVLETKGAAENLKLLEDSPKEVAEDKDISDETKQNLKALGDDARGVSVAIVQSGVADQKARDDLQALGSLYREPLWVFYRGDAPVERLSQLAGKRIGVGPDGSGTLPIATQLLAANGLSEDADAAVAKKTTLVKPENIADSAAALQQGELDAAFFVAAFDTPYIQQLLNDDKIHLLSFGQQEAYHRKYRFLSELTVPSGLVNLGQNIPSKDVAVLAPTAMLVARTDLHPALISLLLTVSTRIHGQGDELSNPGEFPSTSYTDIPIGKDAEEYYKYGPPVLQRYLPFWLASLVDRLKIMLVPLIMLFLPLFRAAPPLVRWRTRRKIYLWYSALRDIDKKIAVGISGPALDEQLKRLRDINHQVAFVEVPLSYMEEFYHLRLHLRMLQEQLEKLRAQQGTAELKGA